MRGVVVGMSPHQLRRWIPCAHFVHFDSGRREEVQLANGSGRGQSFRFLSSAEAAEMHTARQLRPPPRGAARNLRKRETTGGKIHLEEEIYISTHRHGRA